MSTRPDATLAPTDAQRRVLALQRLAPGEAHCNVARVLRLRGPLDAARLERSFEALVRRHASLRTSFHADGAVRRVHGAASFTLERDALVPAPGESVAAAIGRVADEASWRPFDLAAAPLMRARLVELGPADHVLVFTIHNVVCDGWSLGLLMRELADRYARDDATVSRDADAASPVTAPAADAGALARWRDRLAQRPAPIAWPGAPRDGDLEAHVHVVHPDDAHRSAIAALQRAAGVSPYAIHLAAFVLALRTLGAGDDVLVATPVARRPAGSLTSVGLHTDLVPVRVDLASVATFDALLRAAHAVAGEAVAAGVPPFATLCEALGDPSGASGHPLVDAVINVTGDRQRIPTRWGDVDVERLDLGRARALLALSLFVRDDAPLRVEVVHRLDLVPPQAASRFADRLRRVIVAGAADPGARLDRLRTEAAT